MESSRHFVFGDFCLYFVYALTFVVTLLLRCPTDSMAERLSASLCHAGMPGRKWSTASRASPMDRWIRDRLVRPLIGWLIHNATASFPLVHFSWTASIGRLSSEDASLACGPTFLPLSLSSFAAFDERPKDIANIFSPTILRFSHQRSDCTVYTYSFPFLLHAHSLWYANELRLLKEIQTRATHSSEPLNTQQHKRNVKCYELIVMPKIR